MADRRVAPSPAEELDRSRTVEFTFDGARHRGFVGDTVGSALAAQDVTVLSRSFKYHRPRGLLCCSGRCPNCLVDVDGTPNMRACQTPIADGMKVRSQNARPSLRHDLLSLTDRFDRLMPVGFYYKTFIRPRFLWPLYERILRSAAGLGRVDVRAVPSGHPRRRHLHTDVVVVGGGPAGCLAALEAAAAGARVVLVDDAARLGGHLRNRTRPVESADERLAAATGIEAANRLAGLVAAEPRIEHLPGATATGVYEGGLVGAVQGDTFVRIRARHLVVATGSMEHPALFDANDRPGVMLASAVLRLRHGQGVLAGDRCIVVTDDDHGWRSALELLDAGVKVRTLVDARPSTGARPGTDRLVAAAVEIVSDAIPVRARGRERMESLVVRASGVERSLECDLVAMAMRPEPVIALLTQAGARAEYHDGLGEFVATALPEGVSAAGSVLGVSDDGSIAGSGVEAGRAAAYAAQGMGRTGGSAPGPAPAPPAGSAPPPALVAPGGRKQFVCLCEDVTTKELTGAVKEGFTDLETLKRYATVTMGPCQGKMCGALVTRLHAANTGTTPGSVGLTTARPPWQPVPLGVLAGPHHAPIRRTPMHRRHEALRASWVDMGEWKRPLAYGDVAAEVRAVREAAGLIDVSTLGKLEVQGPDAGTYLDWLHPNRFGDLAVGRVRYRAMLDDAGIILDDGTVARLGPERYLVSTTTGTIDAMEQWFGWWLAGSERDVSVVNVTSQLAAVNLAGPRAREVLTRLTDADVSRETMPYLAAAEATVAGIPAILLRIGFVGEVGFEIHVPADRGEALWEAILEAGRDLGITPFGVEAQRVLRLEKQHAIVGQDTDALSNPIDAGMGWLVKRDKPDFIGRDASLALVDGADRPDRQVLTGFQTAGPLLPAEGAAIVRDGRAVGRVTSCKLSPTLGHPIGLAWLAAEDAVDGAQLTIRLGVGTDGATTPGTVRTRPFYDPDGERLRA